MAVEVWTVWTHRSVEGRRVGDWSLCCGVLSPTKHPQQYREFQARQTRNRTYCSVFVLDGSCNFDSLLGRHVPNSTGSFRIRRSKTSLAVVHVTPLSSDWAILLFTLSLGRIWSLTRDSLSVGGGLVFDRRFTFSGRSRVCQGKVRRAPKSGARPDLPNWLNGARPKGGACRFVELWHGTYWFSIQCPDGVVSDCVHEGCGSVDR